MRVATLARVVSLSLLLIACDPVQEPTPPETQSARLHIAGALKITMTDLETLGGNFSTATAINRWGTVVGYSTTVAGQMHAFRWNGFPMQDLTPSSGDFSGGEFSRAIDINDLGQIAGTARLTGTGECEQLGPVSGGCRAFRWNGTTMQNLGTLPGGNFSVATDINEVGHVVGFSTTTAHYPARFAETESRRPTRSTGTAPHARHRHPRRRLQRTRGQSAIEGASSASAGRVRANPTRSYGTIKGSRYETWARSEAPRARHWPSTGAVRSQDTRTPATKNVMRSSGMAGRCETSARWITA